MLVSVVYSVIIAVWWAGACTVLLPLTVCLYFWKTLNSLFYAWMFTYCGPYFQPPMVPLRKRVFDLLGKEMAGVARPLEVLELGAGDGENLAFYPRECCLTVVDVNKFFESHLRKNLTRLSDKSIFRRVIVCDAGDMKEVESESIDVVVVTYVLCTAKDSKGVLNEVLRVLKPGGKYLFIEHVRFPTGNGFNRTLQRIANPVWRLYFNGCNVNRDSDLLIREAGFSNIHMEDLVFAEGFSNFLFSPQVLGIATK